MERETVQSETGQYVDAALKQHGLELDEACRAEVEKQFALLKRMNQQVESEPLAAEIESASIFRL